MSLYNLFLYVCNLNTFFKTPPEVPDNRVNNHDIKSKQGRIMNRKSIVN